MILYHPQLGTNFTDYGILVPIRDDRSDKTFAHIERMFPGQFPIVDLESIAPIERADLLLAHCEGFVDNLYTEKGIEEEIIKCYELIDSQGKYNRYDPKIAKLKLSEMLPEILLKTGASVHAMRRALEEGFCFYLGGGMHHAMSFGGRGFCPVNDIVIGIRMLLRSKEIKHAWVIDVDAHKGDGTAELTQGDSSITTFSIHMKNGWPLDGPEKDENGKTHPWFLGNDLDIEIEVGQESTYLEKLELGLSELKQNCPKPDLIVVVNGADPYIKDALPSAKRLQLSKEQMLDRDLLLFDYIREMKVPQCYLMAGGYGPHSYEIYSQFLEKALMLMR